ncbi:hypothetical protein V202x_55330 [Gimesia aquarii]|uniref:Uncharacterized protein n=1 Tax=Gimesia aquarii TaxID=2527964 RepID=A0A517X3M6_9PLAN|nr:hypothetical protein V202x_55330 [Gimesia aquarii]
MFFERGPWDVGEIVCPNTTKVSVLRNVFKERNAYHGICFHQR